MKVACAYCGKEREVLTGYYNRSVKAGMKFYCNRKHFGLDRRNGKTKAQKKKEKAEYDKNYRATSPTLKQRRKAYHERTYNPEKQRAYNKIRYPKHLKYLQRPEYKEWKKNYDEQYLAKRDYGIFWESSLLLKELELWLLNNSPDGMKFQMGITNKTQLRKRLWQRTTKKQQKNLLQRA